MKIISKQQFNFRENTSTIHAGNIFVSETRAALEKKENVAACFIDLERAFDTVWREGLIFKMSKYKFPEHVTKITHSMINNKKFYVEIGKQVNRTTMELEDGLQQGAVTSPLLFNIYTAELAKLYKHNQTDETKTIFFADDLLICTKGKNIDKLQDNLQKSFDNINSHYKTWKLKINPLKSETILFRNFIRTQSKKFIRKYKEFEIEADGTIIPHKNSVKYLGIKQDNRLNMTKHVDEQLDKAKRVVKMYSKIFYSDQLDTRLKSICYMLQIGPIITYGCPIWFGIGPPTMEKIRTFERKCLRACTGMYRTRESDFEKYHPAQDLYNAANITGIDSFIIKLTRNYYTNLKYTGYEHLLTDALAKTEDQLENIIEAEYHPPEMFTYLDKTGRISDETTYR